MKAFPKNKFLSLGVMIILLLGSMTCEKEPTKPEPVAPELPPVQSLQADLSFFNSPSDLALNKATSSYKNFFTAISKVSVINLTVFVASVVPRSVLSVALSQPPELKEDGKWHWVFNADQGINSFSVDLAGWTDSPSAEAVWEVYISSSTHTPELNKFLWFYGRSKIDNKAGYWIFNDDKSPDSPVEVLKAEWEIADENGRSLVFTNVKAASSDFGDYLKYGMELTDRFLIFYDASESRTNTIYWNAETRAGYIELFDFNSGQKSYWDESFNDTSGPPA